MNGPAFFRSTIALLAAFFATIGQIQPGAVEPGSRPLGFDSGGGYAVSSHYTAYGSLGGLGSGSSHSEAGSVTLQHGYAALVNDPPVARPDALIGPRGTEIGALASHQVIVNDFDLERDRLTLVSVASRSQLGGMVTWEADWIRYTPPAGSPPGIDQFSYLVVDAFGDRGVGKVCVVPPTGALPWETVLHVASPVRAGQLHFIVQMPVAPKLTVIASGDLRSWQPLFTNSPAGEIAELSVPVDPAEGMRIYRGVSTITAGESLFLKSFRFLPGGKARLELQDAPQLRTVLEASVDLLHWHPVLTNLAVRQQSVLLDFPPPLVPSNFLRVPAGP